MMGCNDINLAMNANGAGLEDLAHDGGRTYRQILIHEYNFSPRGATFQREDQRFDLPQVTISVSRLFQTRAGQAWRLSRRSGSSLRRLPVSEPERVLSRWGRIEANA